MYIIKKRGIVEVKVLTRFEETGELRVKSLSTGHEEIVFKEDVYNSIEEAKIAQKEIEIVKTFKRGRRNKKGELTCKCCGHKAKDLTVDHIKPLKDFGGRKALRSNSEAWEKAWNFSNLQILCHDCNQFKNSMSQEQFEKSVDMIDLCARRLNNRKKLRKATNKNTPANKISYGLATSGYAKNRKELVGLVAKSDSNILRLDSILNQVEAYETLPNTNVQ